MAKNPFHVFRRPVVTEKSTLIRHQYSERAGHDSLVKYTFEVAPTASKPEIRAALEELFPEVRGHIVQINTMRTSGKVKDPDKNRRGRRFRPGRTIHRKKAIVTLRDGVTIDRFEGV
ncbi:50S ribosomal protein L23 [Candidatus Poribacteria bacterium]|nr:50S ribosomal protein L23 [Candidatus Poribacteria bacterium]